MVEVQIYIPTEEYYEEKSTVLQNWICNFVDFRIIKQFFIDPILENNFPDDSWNRKRNT